MRALRSIERRLRKSRAVQGALVSLYTRYILFVLRSTRWRHVGFDAVEADLAAGRPHVLCLWHERLALAPFFRDWRGTPVAALASAHEDARVLEPVFARMGIGYIALRSSGDNSAVLRAAVRALRAGTTLGVTPDGPLGPRRTAKPGAVLLAAMSGAPLTPIAFATSRRIVLPSWDRFVLPLPWGRGAFVAGDSMTVPPRPEDDAVRAMLAELGRAIDATTDRADAAVQGTSR